MTNTKLVEVSCVCGHAHFVHPNTTKRVDRAKRNLCPICKKEYARKKRIPERIRSLEEASGIQDEKYPMPDFPQVDIHLKFQKGCWIATFKDGEAATAKTPTGAILMLFAAYLKSEVAQ